MRSRIRHHHHRKRKWFSKKVIIIVILLCLIAGSYVIYPKIKRIVTAPQVYKDSSGTHYQFPKFDEITNDVVQPGPKTILPGAKWVPQSFNNCGPATTSMILQYFGHSVGQDVTKAALRTNPDDKNVFSYEIQEYVQKDFGVSSKLLFNGDIHMIKKLIANGFYVMLEDWLHPNEDIGHVTILRGYDDEQGVFIADDSYLGNNIVYKYQNFEETQWKAFNREYIPFYKPEHEDKVKAIVGENWDETTMYQNAVKKAEAEIAANDRDMYAHFNLGTSYYALGEYEKAYEAFQKAKEIGWPKRMLWYQIQPIQTLNELGKYQEAIAMADTGLWANDSFAELHVEKARAYQGMNNTEKAREEVEKALQYAPNLQSAKDLRSSL